MDAEKILEVFDGEILMFFCFNNFIFIKESANHFVICLETKEPKVQDWIYLLKILKTS